MEEVKRNSLQAWILAARPKTLTGAITPVMIGTALAAMDGRFHWLPALICCLFASLMQIAANFINDLFDFLKGTDREDRLGPERACAQGWISPQAMKTGIIITVALACLIGCTLLFFAGWELIIVGVLCVLVVGYLVFLSLSERHLAYFLIGLFALGSIGFLYSSDYFFNQVLEPHQQIRIKVVLGMEEDLAGAGYNVNQSKIAIGSGGLTGKGFLNGTQTKLKYVPEQDTDFIFCTVGEEEGFIGSTVVLLLFLTLILRLISVAERQPSAFGRVYGYSVLSIFLFHLFINIGMVLGLTPVIGIPLPFFSYGGSSLWGFTILLFIFLRIDAGRNRRL